MIKSRNLLLNSIKSRLNTPLVCGLSTFKPSDKVIKRRVYRNEDSKVVDNNLRQNLVEDKNSAPLDVYCSGCGTQLQSLNHTQPGFMSANFVRTLSIRELKFKKCLNCELLEKNQKLVNSTDNLKDYEKDIINRIIETKKCLVLLVIDLLDIPNSINEAWTKLKYQEMKKTSESGEIERLDIQIIIVGNKLDLLPNTGPGWLDSIRECLFKNCIQKGIKGRQIKHIELISAKKNFNIENLLNRIIEIWNGKGDIYLLGMTNAGKSLLFNALLDSDICDTRASEALNRATISKWPNTTCNLIKFPLQFINDDMLRLRQKRLAMDYREQVDLDAKRNEKFEEFHRLEDATFECIRGNSFLSSSLYSGKIDTNVGASFTWNEKTSDIVQGRIYENAQEIVEERQREARSQFDFALMNRRYCLYDTPGVIKHQQILTKLTTNEIEQMIPMKLLTPKIFWMAPGQTLMVGGLMRVDLLESTNSERVFFTILANSHLPIIEPFDTNQAEFEYNKIITKLNANRNEPFPKQVDKNFQINCIGNHKSTADIVFSLFGWIAVNSKQNVNVNVRAYAICEEGLQLRQPSLLPFVVNMRHAKCYEKTQQFRKKFFLPSYKILKSQLKNFDK